MDVISLAQEFEGITQRMFEILIKVLVRNTSHCTISFEVPVIQLSRISKETGETTENRNF